MIDTETVLHAVEARGFSFYTGVPCSYLRPLINQVITRRRDAYLGATSEGEAVAIAAGAWLAGRDAVVMCQNSGLGNMVNPLTSLNWPFQIPALLVVTWRGRPGEPDEPQHELMGRITGSVLDVIGVPNRLFPAEAVELAQAMAWAREEMERTSLPVGFILAKDTVADTELDQPPTAVRPRGTLYRDLAGGDQPQRAAVLARTLAVVPAEAALIATTGKCGRELFTLEDRPQHLYMVGAMGAASAVGLGVALHSPRPVVVLDGDGAALMKMGNLATIGAAAPKGLVHVILDNGTHDSTGGQATVSPNVDFAGVAIACGYADAVEVDNLSAYEKALRGALATPGPHLIHARIAPGSMAKLGRPTVKPPEVARRFRAFLAGGVA